MPRDDYVGGMHRFPKPRIVSSSIAGGALPLNAVLAFGSPATDVKLKLPGSHLVATGIGVPRRPVVCEAHSRTVARFD